MLKLKLLFLFKLLVIINTAVKFSKHYRKKRNVLFYDTLNTFYLRLYGVRHMVKAHSDSERGNLLPPHRLLFPISSKGSFICIIPQTIYGVSVRRNLLLPHHELLFMNNSKGSFICTHFIYGYNMVSESERGNLLLPHQGLRFQKTTRVLLYIYIYLSIQDSTYHNLCYTSSGALAGTKNSPMGPP